MNKKIKSVFMAICAVASIGACVGSFIYRSNQYTEREYKLNEMNDGVYAIYYTTHSNVPAYNYEVVTLCCNGNVYTFKGDVYISFTDDIPYVKIKDYNIVYADDIYVYVPQGTVIYQPSVNVGG